MYKSIDIVDIIGSTIYVNEQITNISISELKKVVGRIETNVEYMRVDFSKHKIHMAEEMMQIIKNTNNGIVALPQNADVRKGLVLKYFQLDQELRKEIEQIISETIEL